MYYVLQNLEAFYVVDPSMTKLGEFRTFEEAEDFCGYLNDQFINGNQPDLNFVSMNDSQRYFQNQDSQVKLNTNISSGFANQEFQPLMNQYGNQLFRGIQYPNPFTNTGVSYGNITINCNGGGTSQPTREVQTVEKVVSPQVTEIQSVPKIIVETKSEPETVVEAAKPHKINFLKDESLSTSNSLENIANLGGSSLNRGIGLSNKFNDSFEEKPKPRYDEVTNSWITPTEINEFVQKLEQ